MNEYLQSIYTDPAHEAGYTSPVKLYAWLKKHGEFKPTLQQVKKWLAGQESYTLHRAVRRKFPRNRVYVNDIDVQWDVDLADFRNISKHNDNYSYVLFTVDILSKKCRARAIKTKRPSDVVQAFKEIFAEGVKPLRIRSDKGSEFISQITQKFFKGEDIVHSKTQSTEIKASNIERLIRSLKATMYRYFTQNNTYRYIDKLQAFIEAYNNRPHKTIKAAPASVTKQNAHQVWFEAYAAPLLRKPGKATKVKFKVGDMVRITHIKGAFTRDFYARWSGEIFTVSDIDYQNRIPLYKLTAYNKEEITGLFYEQELQMADIDVTQPYKVEKILRTRKRRGKGTEYLIKFLFWPSQYNEWVSKDKLESL